MHNSGSPTGIGLLDHIDGLVARLCALSVDAIRDSQIESIHHARVTTRRLKAATDLLKPIASGELRKPFSKTLRRLRRRLSGLRDLDVLRSRLDEAPSGAEVGVRWLRGRFSTQRAGLAIEAQELRLPRLLDQLGAWWGLKHEFVESADRIPQLLRDAICDQSEDFAASADFVASHDLSSTSGETSGADPHELRIIGKSLRYTLELADAHSMPPPEHALKLFKQMQDALGEWHDWVVLCDRAMLESLESGLSHTEPETQSGVLRLADFAAGKSASAMQKFRELWREHGRSLTTDLHAAYADLSPPPVVAASRSKRSRKGRDRRDSAEPQPPANPAPGAAPTG